jgi:hypothetical protein
METELSIVTFKPGDSQPIPPGAPHRLSLIGPAVVELAFLATADP